MRNRRRIGADVTGHETGSDSATAVQLFICFRQGATPVSVGPDRTGLVAPSPLCPET
ncbi:hypothetical protein MMMB2_4808 [Mycobacterium marinum MB2]|nr:hypothetical protein MMSP_0919 [Mycobacterium sp. 012931]EPQ70974.1 hypothetical protein MMMB2_4808 [Mycobacterium marinum MB2]